ncbi:LysM peptidoglycan-binding domain-containing protein [Sutcliffiella horikoshii]|uniref:LysM peptidoglycan-binding domain-containing protein n=1 Tax=Sutcliffiella horikoshii TaxID=79883 RepID=UPI001CFF4872|nr:LysM peptidoglycan-binding domain-containing protein [Sutcliffiella horikoshii]
MVESQNIRSRKERIETQKRINKGKRDKKIVSYVLAGTLAVSAFITVNARGEVLANEAVHQVKPGDTLFSLAQKYGVSIKELKELNGLKSDIIKVGQVLQLSGSGSKEVVENKKSIHEVSSGDTLFSIAKKYGLSVTELKQINNLKTDLIKVGQVLKVGTKATSYKVIAGDTLISISKKFNVTVGSIQKENNLTTDTIRIGQQLIIPASNHGVVESQEKVSKAFYTVAAGETLWGIAKKFNMSAHKIKKDNHMSSEYVLIGQELKIQTDGMFKANAVITGVVDKNSVEFLIEGEKEPVVLRVAYGTAPNYDIISGAELSIIYKKGMSPVLVDLVFANEEFGY